MSAERCGTDRGERFRWATIYGARRTPRPRGAEWRAPATKVKMANSLKVALRKNKCAAHVREFGNCVGIVEGPATHGEACGWDR